MRRRDIIFLSRWRYFAYAARLGASAPRASRRRLLRLHRASGCLGQSSTTSPTPRVRVPRLVVDYFAYAARPGASACCVAHRRLLLLCCAIRCLGSSRGSSSTSRRLATRLLVGCTGSRRAPGDSVSRLGYWSPSCTGSTAYAVHPDAPSSPLDFSSVGRTGSCRAPGHSVSRLGYSPLGCTGSTAPMSCIRPRRLAARLLVGRLHWLSPCAQSLRLTSRLLVARLHWLYCLRRAPRHAVSPLDFSSVGHTGSRRAWSLCPRGSTTPCAAVRHGYP
jgi:hypothetical protein